MNCTQKFNEIYLSDPEAIAFCPYRICPIGAHSDHNLGKITGLALNKGISIAYRTKKNGVVEVTSLQFSTTAQWHVNEVPDNRQNDWADYLRGATWALGKKHRLSYGIDAVIEGTMPIGGLSSSASVIIAFISALCAVNKITLTDHELIMTALQAETDYVGVSVGKLDQSCEVYSRKNHLLYLDTKDDSFELIPQNPKMKPYKIAIFFSGVERSLAGTRFNMRVDELRSAAYALKAYSGMDYGKFCETYLRDVPYAAFDKYKDRLPETWRLRAEHWYGEFARVEAGAEAWRRGDIEAYGKLSFESGYSSIYNWDTGSPELKTLYNIMTRTDGIYGGRFSGAGFKGCCMALIDPAFEESVSREVTEAYLKEFPALKGKYEAFICESADGIGTGGNAQ